MGLRSAALFGTKTMHQFRSTVSPFPIAKQPAGLTNGIRLVALRNRVPDVLDDGIPFMAQPFQSQCVSQKAQCV